MHEDTNNKKHASGTASPSKPRPPKPSETEYLQHEADDAREAASRTLGEMGQSLKDAADVRAWARKYPWTTLGAAAAAGYLAVCALVPSRRQKQEKENAALLERILTDEQIESRLRELAAEKVAKPRRESAVQSIVGSLIKTFGPAVQAAVVEALSAHPQAEAPGDEPAAETSDEAGAAEPNVPDEPPPLPE